MEFLWPGLNGVACNYISAPPNAEFCHKARRNLVILGSTGSIGRNALTVLESAPEKFHVLALAGGRNIQLLSEQARRWRPAILAVQDLSSAQQLSQMFTGDYQPQIFHGAEGYAHLASLPDADLVLSAQSGSAGLAGTLGAAMAGHVIALANKESLVLAGGLMRGICAATGASILPVDSEHYAIFQCLSGKGQTVSRLILTASGGPFRDYTRQQMQAITPSQALRHPNWQMGAKITIDSATLMNKGLEVIEAMHLYGVASSQISVLVHPQSIVHSLVEFADHSQLAQMAIPDMKLPIAACLFWPHCAPPLVPALDLANVPPLTFRKPDLSLFPCLDLALKAGSRAAPIHAINTACVILNAANEKAVEFFLSGQCSFCDIAGCIDYALGHVDTSLNTCPSFQGHGGIWKKTENILNFMAALEQESHAAVLRFLENKHTSIQE